MLFLVRQHLCNVSINTHMSKVAPALMLSRCLLTCRSKNFFNLPIILVFKKQRQEDQKFYANLDYTRGLCFKEMDMDIYLIIIFSDIINCQEVKNVLMYVTQTIKQLSI